ncbi:MAG: hypothetical protein ABSD63_18665, partial [Candidatus Korobacteraceae bacterium]
QSRDSPVFSPQPCEPRTKPAMLAHRSGELSLDNAFSLIEGHPIKAINEYLINLNGAAVETAKATAD